MRDGDAQRAALGMSVDRADLADRAGHDRERLLAERGNVEHRDVVHRVERDDARRQRATGD